MVMDLMSSVDRCNAEKISTNEFPYLTSVDKKSFENLVVDKPKCILGDCLLLL